MIILLGRPLNQFVKPNISQLIMWQQLNAFFRPNVRMEKTFFFTLPLPYLFCGMVVGARQGGLNISETTDLLEFS